MQFEKQREDMKTAVFPGSFDPVTSGHLDLIKRASKMFDRLILGVLINSSKKPLLTVEERVRLLKEVTKDLKNVEVEAFDGLLVDFVDRCDADVIVRGLRTSNDFEYVLATSPEYSYVSSSAVKELMRYNADISGFVPEEALKYLN